MQSISLRGGELMGYKTEREVCQYCTERHCCRGICKEMNDFLINKKKEVKEK